MTEVAAKRRFQMLHFEAAFLRVFGGLQMNVIQCVKSEIPQTDKAYVRV